MSTDSAEQRAKQIMYRDARYTDTYDNIWQTVGKCVFCDLNEKYVFFEENGVVMTITLYAYIDGHLMIVPRRHIKSTKELTELEWQTIRKFTYIAKKIIKKVHGVKGVQFIQKDGAQATSTVEHIHFHCVPFDAPDLMKWNYRKLKNTPLENVTLYKNVRTKIVSAATKYEQKYQNQQLLPIVCDLIILSTDNKILFQKRKPEHALSPDYLTMPGGHSNDNGNTLEQELAREVHEETGLTLDPTSLQLVSSKLDGITRSITEPHLSVTYTQPVRHLRNTYIIKEFDAAQTLVAGDDAAALLWIDIENIQDNKKIHPNTQQIIMAALA